MKLVFKLILLLCIIIIITKHLRSPTELHNSVELRAWYKNYIVTDKYIEDNKYYFILYNPYSTKKQVSKVEVNSYIYYNVYFINDTIK